MTFGDALRACGRYWVIILIGALVGLGAAFAYNATATPLYSSGVSFFVSASGDQTGSALQDDEFAQRRLDSYAQLLTSERVVAQLISAAGVDESPDAVARAIVATPEPDTVILHVAVTAEDKDTSMKLASAIAADFGDLVSRLDDSKSSNVQLSVISGPTLQADPVAPRVGLNIAIGVIAGLAIGIIVALILGRRRTPITSAAQLERVSGLPVRATIPFLSALSRPGTPEEERQKARRRLNLEIDRLTIALGLDVPVDQVGRHVIGFTAARSGDGTTLLLSVLARTLARMGRSVVVVDANFRHSGIAEVFGAQQEPGTNDVLSNTATLDEVVRETTTPGLSIITAGTTPTNLLDVFGSPALYGFIAELRTRYEFVLIDAPAFWPYVDATQLARIVDGVVLVVGRGRTTSQQLATRLESFSAASPLVIAAVLNDPGTPRARGDESGDSSRSPEAPVVVAAPPAKAAAAEAEAPAESPADAATTPVDESADVPATDADAPDAESLDARESSDTATPGETGDEPPADTTTSEAAIDEPPAKPANPRRRPTRGKTTATTSSGPDQPSLELIPDPE